MQHHPGGVQTPKCMRRYRMFPCFSMPSLRSLVQKPEAVEFAHSLGLQIAQSRPCLDTCCPKAGIINVHGAWDWACWTTGEAAVRRGQGGSCAEPPCKAVDLDVGDSMRGSYSVVLTNTPELPFKRPQMPSNRDHMALNRATLGGLGI